MGPLLQDLKTVWESTKPKELEEQIFTLDEGGGQTELNDLMLVNGSNVAKHLRFPIRHTERAFRRVDTPPTRRSEVFKSGLAMAMGRVAGDRCTALSFQVVDDILAHTDGEEFWVPSGASVTAQAGRPFQALSLRLSSGQSYN